MIIHTHAYTQYLNSANSNKYNLYYYYDLILSSGNFINIKSCNQNGK